MRIPFNKPYFSGDELLHIKDAIEKGYISGNYEYTKKCHQFFEENYGFQKCLLTHSCTAALEMAALLLDLKDGDEVIMPSYTFVSTANAFILRGVKVVFADVEKEIPNLSPKAVEAKITDKTKAIVLVHYAGIACDMDAFVALAKKYNLHLIEDAAQAIDSFYKGKPLGSFGTFSTFSFHETKNINCGEGGMLVINDASFNKRAEVIWEKGTNRAAFYRGEIDKYGWVDVGSSYLPSEITAAYLWAQLQNIEQIQHKRKHIWNKYLSAFQNAELDKKFLLPHVPNFATNNAHIFWMVCNSIEERQAIIERLKAAGILAVFHYQSLHLSNFYLKESKKENLPNTEKFSDCLLRLPLYVELEENVVEEIINILVKSA